MNVESRVAIALWVSLLALPRPAASQAAPAKPAAAAPAAPATSTKPTAPAAPAKAVDLAAALPLDPKVQHGELPNGIDYYIRVNQEPKNRAELRLVINAGSILEAEDQRGLAHFVEHMAFNGTQHFAAQEMVDYLQSTGMRFGADINAFTSFDETVYMLTVPTDVDSVVDKAFLVLADWARGSTFDPAEVDKERGVVIEEWRLGRGASQRLNDKHLPVLLHGSRYAERLPIGKKEVLETFAPEAAARFVADWYRPELMAVVAVGDFDPARIEALLRQHFQRFAASPEPVDRPLYPVPEHPGTLFSIATDVEATTSGVSVAIKSVRRERGNVEAYRRTIVENLFSSALNMRLFELAQKADPPYIRAGAGRGSFVRPLETWSLSVTSANNGIERGLDAVLAEAVRVQRHGVTAGELERAKERLLSAMESAYNEREKTDSAAHASEYIDHFLEHVPAPGITYEFEMIGALLPGIQLDEVNAVARNLAVEDNRVVRVSAPEKEGVGVPDEAALRQIFAAVASRDIEPYVDTTSDAPLVASTPPAARITARQRFERLGLELWTLANGARVYVKRTDFKDDEIIMRAWSPGGTSLASDANYLSASQAAGFISSCGLGEFSLPDLEKKLSGKQVGVRPFVAPLSEGLSGQARPQDLETLLQLVYLNFLQPRRDADAFQGQITRFRGVLENRAADPGNAFGDTLRLVATKYHKRSYPLTAATLSQVELDPAFAFYKDRFADASDFTFAFVGNVDPAVLEPLVCSYIGGLPSLKRKETWRDIGVERPTGVVQRQFRRGVDPKARTAILFMGAFDWKREERYALNALTEALQIRLREVLREDLGGVYGVQVGGGSQRDPKPEYRVQVGFQCDPERLEELTKQALEVIAAFRDKGPDADDVTKVAEIQRKNYEVSLRENRYWLSEIEFRDSFGLDLDEILEYEKLYALLDVDLVRRAAKKYLRPDHYVQVSMQPEATASTPAEGGGGK